MAAAGEHLVTTTRAGLATALTERGIATPRGSRIWQHAVARMSAHRENTPISAGLPRDPSGKIPIESRATL
jgi:hypothetical protein